MPSSLRIRRLLHGACIVLAATGISAAGCSDHAHDTPSDVAFQGEANADGFETFAAAAPKEDAARAPTLTAPANGAKVPSATPQKFEWKPAAAMGPAPAARERYAAVSPPRFVFPLPIGPLRTARAAHGAPMNGRAYLLTLKSGGNNVVRVFTTTTTYEPDAAAWQKLKDAKSITATIATASFDNNNVVSGSGPFVSPATSFTIEP
jgi:hypothetical protein